MLENVNFSIAPNNNFNVRNFWKIANVLIVWSSCRVFARQNAQSCYDFPPVILGAKLDLCCERNLHLQLQNLRYAECAFDCLTSKVKAMKEKDNEVNSTGPRWNLYLFIKIKVFGEIPRSSLQESNFYKKVLSNSR